MVQTRAQKKNSKQVSLSESDFYELNKNIFIKHNDIKNSLHNVDNKFNNVVNQIHNIQQNQMNGYLFNQLYLIMILIGIIMIYFYFGFIDKEIELIKDMIQRQISYNYEDFSIYHSYLFNTTFSEDLFDKLVSHPKISELDLNFYVNIHENNII